MSIIVLSCFIVISWLKEGENLYISEVEIDGLRGFSESKTIRFNDGINVIIGHNNSGKTTILKALDLVFGKTNKKLSVDDFNKNVSIASLKEKSPSIKITVTLKESSNEDEYSEDLVTVATWLTKIEKPYEAKLTYECFLSKKEEDNYEASMSSISSEDPQDYWNEIKYNFQRKYVNRILIGNPSHENILDSESISKFDFQFLSAIRDVERDMFSGRNSLLKEVIDFFIDYEVKTNNELSNNDKKKELKAKRVKFSNDAQVLITQLQDRMKIGKKHMLKYAEDTGASYENMKPDFEGRILDTELYSALKLIVESETGVKIPAYQNGLGYNNLIYISLLLAKMQKNASGDYMGSNAKVYSMLAIEEPEAHLHPNMQYKFLKFLSQNKEKEVRQIFITTHSPNITAAVDLKSIILLHKNNGDLNIAYPGAVFSDSVEDQESLKYVQRFLDVTKSDMFFAKGVLLVEGISEQLLIPEFSKLLDEDLIDKQISIINIGGRYFNHFLKLFDTNNKNAINKKVACITDLDPVKKKIGVAGSSWIKSFPYEGNYDDGYEYKECSNNTISLYDNHANNIKVYSQEKGKSCTFEYDLILFNPTAKKLVTKSVTNNEEIKLLMDTVMDEKVIFEDFLSKVVYKKFRDKYGPILISSKLGNEEKKKYLLASRYLKSISKGVVAQELAQVFSDNIKDDGLNFKFTMPDYISEAIKWICQ